jgi:hypothetical protein
MLRITNISITRRAASILRREHARVKLSSGDVFGLVYVFTYTNPDGTIVKGFEPGYMAGPWPINLLTERWAVAHPPDNPEFHFLPRFTWTRDDWYLIDLAGRLFQIGPAPRAQSGTGQHVPRPRGSTGSP